MEASLLTCKNCGNNFQGKYCNECGEKVYTEHDRSVVHFFEETFHFVTHFEGSFFTTIKTMFTKPGLLSQEWCRGLRKRFFKPISFFLLLVVIYLLFPVFEGLNMKLYYHVHHNLYGGFALEKVKHLMATGHLSEQQLSDAFQKKSVVVSKFLLLVIIPLTALFFWPLTFKRRKLFYDQVIFSTEINSMYLLWGFMILPLLTTVFILVARALSYTPTGINDDMIGIILYAVLCAYVGIAAHRFYGVGKARSIGLALLFYAIHFIVVQVLYKFLLFVLVINQIH
ncbi:MAG TPA: DUF3667 domain-containing protein [Flavisolibacter sp.]|jgi:hypothetical protein|nr:DUF3667 domain-containing protein [Flavisolibacter sp.]